MTTKEGVVVGHFSFGLFFDPFGLPRFLAPVVVVVVVAAAVVVAAVVDAAVVVPEMIFVVPGDVKGAAALIGARAAAAIASK